MMQKHTITLLHEFTEIKRGQKCTKINSKTKFKLISMFSRHFQVTPQVSERQAASGIRAAPRSRFDFCGCRNL